MKLTKAQKDQIYNKTMCVDNYEWVPCINHVLKVLGCEDSLYHDENYEKVEWSGTRPLIRDDRIRNIVQAWAEINGIAQVVYSVDTQSCRLASKRDEDQHIDFVGWIPPLKDREAYTIAELCGEEKE